MLTDGSTRSTEIVEQELPADVRRRQSGRARSPNGHEGVPLRWSDCSQRLCVSDTRPSRCTEGGASDGIHHYSPFLGA